jgi:hypothetical protein
MTLAPGLPPLSLGAGMVLAAAPNSVGSLSQGDFGVGSAAHSIAPTCCEVLGTLPAAHESIRHPPPTSASCADGVYAWQLSPRFWRVNGLWISTGAGTSASWGIAYLGGVGDATDFRVIAAYGMAGMIATYGTLLYGDRRRAPGTESTRIRADVSKVHSRLGMTAVANLAVDIPLLADR